MITRVRLERWKCHRATELAFRPGTNALLGPMGSGKSSIIEAVAFALFGTLPSLRSHRLHADDLIMSRPARANDASVEVSFTVGGVEHTVKRVLERGKGTTYAELRCSGALVDEGAARVTARVEELLRMDLELFLNAVYTAQNGLDEFLTLPKGRRMERLDELLSIHRLEAARRVLTGVLGRVKDRLSDQRAQAAEQERSLEGADLGRLEREAGELEGAVADIERRERESGTRGERARAELERLDGLKRRHGDLEGELARLEGSEIALAREEARLARMAGPEAALPTEAIAAARGEAEGAVARLERARERLAALGRERGREEGAAERLRQRREELAARVAAAPARPLAELERESAAAEDELSGGRARREAAREELASLRSERRGLEGQLARLEPASRRAEGLRSELAALGADAEPEAVEQRLAAAREEAERLGAQEGGLRATLSDLERAAAELGAAGASCPVCSSPLDEHRKEGLLAERRARASRLRANAEKLRRLRDEARARASGLEGQLRRVRELGRELEAAGDLSKERAAADGRLAEVARREGELAALLERLDGELRQGEARARASRDALDGGREVERARGELGGVERELAGRGERLAALAAEEGAAREGFSAPRLDEARSRLARLEAAAERARTLAELDRVRERRAAAIVERDAVGYSATDHAAAVAAVGALASEREGLRQQARDKRDLLGEKRARLGQARAAAEALAGLRERVSRLEGGHEDLVRIRTALADTQSLVRRGIVEDVNGVLSEMWATLYPYGDITGLRLAIAEGGREQGDYALEILDSTGRWTSVDGSASGGERSVACLALRVAFSRVLAPGLSWLVFDEPTHNLDRRAVEELARSLRERLPELFEQVVIVTHDELMENAITGACYRVTRDKDEDLPARVEEV